MHPSDTYHIRYFHYLFAIQALAMCKKKSLHILDDGCGSGELTRAIFKKTTHATLIGCDIDTAALQDFKQHLAGEAIRIKKCDVQRLPFADASFDLVFMFDVLEHVSHPEKTLAEINRVLRPQGIFHLVVPCEGDLMTIDGWIKKLFRKNLKEKPIGHIQQFTYQEVLQLLTKKGFIVKKVHFSYYFLYQLLSVLYYAYATFLKSGEYIPLLGHKKQTGGSFLLEKGVIVGGWLVYLETKLFQLLPSIRGQTAHLTMTKGATVSATRPPKK